MKTDTQPEPVFLQTVSVAIAQLKQRLQQDYEQAYPDLREIVHLVLDEEEAKAWELSFSRICFSPIWSRRTSKPNLQAIEAKHDNVFAPHGFNESRSQPAFALCG